MVDALDLVDLVGEREHLLQEALVVDRAFLGDDRRDDHVRAAELPVVLLVHLDERVVARQQVDELAEDLQLQRVVREEDRQRADDREVEAPVLDEEAREADREEIHAGSPFLVGRGVQGAAGLGAASAGFTSG